MALVADGGGSTLKTKTVSSKGAGGSVFSIARWREEEEERKRREQEAKLRLEEQQIIKNELAQRKSFTPETANPDAPSAAFRQRAQQVQRSLVTEAQRRKDDDLMMRYFRMNRQLGQEKMAARLEAISSSWRTRVPGTDGSSVIMELLLSPYTPEEVDLMIEQARPVLMESTGVGLMWQQETENLKFDLQKKFGLNERQWEAWQEVLDAKEQGRIPEDKTVGIALLAALPFAAPGMAAVGAGAGLAAGIMRGMSFITKAVGTMSAVGVGVSASSEVLEEQRAKGIEEKAAQAEKILEAAKNPVLTSLNTMREQFSPELAENNTVLQQFGTLRRNMLMLNQTPQSRDDVKKILAYYQSVGVGTDLENNGIFTPEWQDAILEAAEQSVRYVFDLQRRAVEVGAAPWWAPINGDLYWMEEEKTTGTDTARVGKATFTRQEPVADREGWPIWLARLQRIEMEREQWKQENPDRYAFMEMSDWLSFSSKDELVALQNRLSSMGFLQELYGGLLQVPLLIGRSYQAMGSALNLQARQRSNPEYQAALKDLFSYVDSKEFVETPYWKEKPKEMSEAFCRTAVKLGYLKDDPVAKEKVAKLDQLQAQMISERYSSDYLLSLGYALPWFDYEEVRKFGEEHPDVVAGFTLGVDALLAVANPVGRIFRRISHPTVKADINAWKKSQRSWDAIYSKDRGIAPALKSKDMGKAARRLGGAKATEVLNSVYRVMGKNADKIDPKSKIVVDLARESVDMVKNGEPWRVSEVLKDAPDELVNNIVNTTQRWLGQQTGTITDYTPIIKRVASRISARESKFGDAISEKILAERLDAYIGAEYVKGAAILPWLRDNKIEPPSRFMEWMQESVSKVQDPWLRQFLTKWTVGQITRAPTAEVEFKSLGALDRMYDAALAVSQDAAWAWNFRNRWAAARTQAQYKRLIDVLDEQYAYRFKTDPGVTLSDLRALTDWGARRHGEMSEYGQALAPDPVQELVEGRRPTFLTEFLSKDSKGNPVYKQAVPDTVYQMYAASLHRSALWAPYNTAHAEGLAKALLQSKNIYRYGIRQFHRLSTPLRQWTVAMGAPLLFQKHAITDTFRTAIDDSPFSILEAFGLKSVSVKGKTIVPRVRSVLARRLDKVLAELPADTVNYVQWVKARVHASEAQWLSGTRRLIYKPKAIRDANGKVVDINASADALVRITRGAAFREWAWGGEDAVRAWLKTDEGKQFLADGGWQEYYQAVQKEYTIGGRTLTPKQVAASVAEEYIEEMVRYWDTLETALPNIMPVLRDMAANDRIPNLEAVKQLIRDNPTDNAVLSTPVHTWGDQTYAGYLVGKAMAANKWNRDVLFDSVFTKQYTKLRKQGMEAQKAAEVAADVAEMNVARVHFDLSNALMIEAKHRWLAWFATKHRLYGTYILKLATERPMLAAMVPEIAQWMEERNAEKGVGEYDKYDLVFDIGGKQVRLNLAPYMWFSEYPLESSLALALERAFSAGLEWSTGIKYHATQAPFGMNFTRMDSFISTLYYSVVKPYGKVNDDASLQEYLNSLPQDVRLRWNKMITAQRAYAKVKGQDITPYEAWNRARLNALKVDGLQAIKVFSGRVVGEEELEIERLQRQLAEITDPEEAKQFIRDNDALAASLNATMDPIEKAALDDAFNRIEQWTADFQAEVENAFANGTLIAKYDDIAKKFSEKFEILTNPVYDGLHPLQDETTYNAAFAKYYGAYNPSEFKEALGMLMPFIPADSVWKAGHMKTSIEKTEYMKVINPIFEAVRNSMELTDKDDSTMLYSLIYDDYIEKPLAEFTGENPYDLIPYSAQTVARYLARGGEAGVYRKDQFLEMVKNQTFRQWLGQGIGSNGKPVSSRPMMAFLSPLKKETLGWNVDPAVKEAWIEYAKYDWALRKAAKEQGVSTSSTKFKKTYQAVMQPLIERLSSEVPAFKNEYQFSQLRLDQRLRAFGVGEGDTPEQRGMDEFLSIVEQMWDELGRTINPATKKPGVTPGAQSAAPVVQKYSAQVARLALKNPVWWNTFIGTYPLSKFGFAPQWRLPSDKYPEYQFIYSNDELPAEEWEEDYWLTIGGGE